MVTTTVKLWVQVHFYNMQTIRTKTTKSTFQLFSNQNELIQFKLLESRFLKRFKITYKTRVNQTQNDENLINENLIFTHTASFNRHPLHLQSLFRMDLKYPERQSWFLVFVLGLPAILFPSLPNTSRPYLHLRIPEIFYNKYVSISQMCR